jgi:hypothetical protein
LTLLKFNHKTNGVQEGADDTTKVSINLLGMAGFCKLTMTMLPSPHREELVAKENQ